MNEIKIQSFLGRSVLLMKIIGWLFLVELIVLIVLKPLFSTQNYLIDLLSALPFLSILILAPIGLYYSIKSMKAKEGKPSYRNKFFLGHLFFSLIALLFLFVVIGDVMNFS